MKVAYVVPRYGTEVVGGAEYAVRMFAERLVAHGWEVEVLTTCALDAMTWQDEYPAGHVVINGVDVHRLRSVAGRDPQFHPYSGGLLPTAAHASLEQAERWIDLQGPLCPAVVDAAASSDADLVVFYPYLYYPTVRGLPEVAERAVMHPAAHDEAPLRLPVFPPVFGAAQGLVFQTYGERRLVHGLFPVAQTPQIVLGLGVEEHPGDEAAARSAFGIGDRPYLLCLGRVDDQKGTGVLWRFFRAYKERHPGPLALVFAGQVVDRPPNHPDIVVTGIVDDAAKWGLLRGSAALVSPSAFEAFSLVVVEGWTAGTAVIVNGACEATREHCQRSGGGLWFGDFAHFEVAVERVTGDAVLRRSLVERGRRYVEENFLWPVVLGRYTDFLRSVLARPRPTPAGDAPA